MNQTYQTFTITFKNFLRPNKLPVQVSAPSEANIPSYPVHNGLITAEDGTQAMWQRTLKKLRTLKKIFKVH